MWSSPAVARRDLGKRRLQWVVVLAAVLIAAIACTSSTTELPGSADVTKAGGGFASMAPVPETAPLVRRDSYFQGAMRARRYEVVFDMFTQRCRDEVGSPSRIEDHLGRVEKLPETLAYDEEPGADVARARVSWNGREVRMTWLKEAGVWRLDTCELQ